MAGLSDYKLTKQDKELFEMIENYDCHGTLCQHCPYTLEIVQANTGFCLLTYIENRLISARESEV